MTKRINRLIRNTLSVLCSVICILQLFGCASRGKQQPTVSPTPDQKQAETAVPELSSIPAGDLIMFVNVRKADSTVILSSGDCYIVDTGTAESAPALLGALNYLGVRSVKALFITHSHSDHVGGLSTLLSCYPVETIYRASISNPKNEKQNPADKAAEKAGKTTVLLSAGDTVAIGGSNKMTVLGPLELNTDDDNDNSLVLDLRMNGCKILLAGDMQFAEEDTLVARYGAELKTDVLRVGNHGNPDATGPAFASITDPDIVVISTDRTADTDSANERVLSLFQGKQIYITDESDMGYVIPIEVSGETVARNVIRTTDLDLEIMEVDKNAQTVLIRNNGADADLSGSMLLSEKGNELFVFPDGAFLASGATCTVSGEDGDGDYRWPGEKKPWNQKKDDMALLFDRFGHLLHAVN